MPRRETPIFLAHLRRMRSRQRTIILSTSRLSWRRLRPILALFAVFALVILAFSIVKVDQTEAVLVADFGRPVRVIDRPGLHAKWPWQTVERFDNRLQLDSSAVRAVMTRDNRALDLAWFLTWKVDNVDRFVRALGSRVEASARLEDLTASVVASKVARYELPDLIKVGGVSVVETLMNEVTVRVAEQAAKDYGLKVVDVRLRRLNFPEDVRPAIYEQIRGDRKRIAAALRAEGESQARSIRGAADLERSKTLASAEADAAKILGEGEAQAARIGNAAYSADPTFYQFLKTLDVYRKALGNRTTLVLSADSPFLKLLTEGVPALEQPPGPLVLPTEPSAAPNPAVVTPLKPATEPTPSSATVNTNPPADAVPASVTPRPTVPATVRPPTPTNASRPPAPRANPGVSGTRPAVTGSRP